MAVCQQADGWCDVTVALVLIKRFTGAVKAACSPELAPFSVHRHRRLAYICIAMLNPRRALQLLLQKNVASAVELHCPNDTKALSFNNWGR